MPYARGTDGVRIHYEVLGRRSSPVVLMIQGLGADKHGWDMQRFLLNMTHANDGCGVPKLEAAE